MIKLPSLKEVAEHLETPYKTVTGWDKKRKLLLRLGLQKYKENLSKGRKDEKNRYYVALAQK